LAALLVALTLTARSQSPDSADARKEIEAAYAKALDALRHAKSMADLDELDRSFDTQDWQSIVPGQSPRGKTDPGRETNTSALRVEATSFVEYLVMPDTVCSTRNRLCDRFRCTGTVSSPLPKIVSSGLSADGLGSNFVLF
jgi:hypothetical protein